VGYLALAPLRLAMGYEQGNNSARRVVVRPILEAVALRASHNPHRLGSDHLVDESARAITRRIPPLPPAVSR
jgi:hypothetical protein